MTRTIISHVIAVVVVATLAMGALLIASACAALVLKPAWIVFTWVWNLI